MIKKLTLTSIAALSLIMISAQAEGMKCQSGKCGAGMMPKAQQSAPMQKMMQHKKKKMASPFLIKHGLPHYTKVLMMHWDDAKLALTPEQKEKLMAVRKETIGAVKQIKPEVMALKKEIVQSARAGAKAAELEAKVKKLSDLEAKATMVHLNCIEKTESILKPEQVQTLKAIIRAQKMKKMQKKMQKMEMKNAVKMPMMKCQAGKCGGAK